MTDGEVCDLYHGCCYFNAEQTHWLTCSNELHIGGVCETECWNNVGDFCTENYNCCDGMYCRQDDFSCQKIGVKSHADLLLD